MELPFGGTFAIGHLRDRYGRGGVRRDDDDHRLRRPAPRRNVRQSPRRVVRQGGGPVRVDYAFHMILGGVDDAALKEMDTPRRRGHHQLQAVHGLSRRLLHRRRPDPARHAEGGGQRRDDLDARRERHRHRRDRRAGGGARARPRRCTTASPGRPRWRARPPTARSSWRWSPAAPVYFVHLSASEALATVAEARDRRPQRVRRDVPAVPVPQPRGPPRRAGVRRRRLRVLAAAAVQARAPRTATCGGACAPTTSRSVAPTTARSA